MHSAGHSSSSSDGLTSLLLCSLCDKPFTEESSYKRHISYCRRAQSRPRTRRKSCRACSLAKVKCSFQTRCSRCSAKGLECVYESRTPVFRKLKAPKDVQLPEVEAGKDQDLGLFGFRDGANATLGDLAGILSPDTGQQPAREAATNRIAPETPALGDETVFSSTDSLSVLMDFEEVYDIERVSGLEDGLSDFSSLMASPSLITSPPPSTVDCLGQIRISNPVMQHSAKLLMQALRAFPQMMLRRQSFPPFIHAHWHSQSTPALPERLATCMSIAHMFASPSPETRPFLWRTIEKEQQSFLKEANIVTREDHLAGIQALMIYVLMWVVDEGPRPSGWNYTMLNAMFMLCTRFKEMNNCQRFSEDEKLHPSPSWADWVFAESRRRTVSMWFIIGRIINVNLGLHFDISLGFEPLPLCLPKTLWEATTQDAWESEYEAWSAAVHKMGMSTFGCLKEAHERSNETAFAKKLDAWNAGVDNLGTLLNIAITMV